MKLIMVGFFLLALTFSAFAGCEICNDGSACCKTGCCAQREGSVLRGCSKSSVIECALRPEKSYCRTNENEHGICSIVRAPNKCSCLPEGVSI